MTTGYYLHHTAFRRGYVSRKNPEGITKPYKGRFGVGYIKLTPCWCSTQYCYVSYFIKEEI